MFCSFFWKIYWCFFYKIELSDWTLEDHHCWNIDQSVPSSIVIVRVFESTWYFSCLFFVFKTRAKSFQNTVKISVFESCCNMVLYVLSKKASPHHVQFIKNDSKQKQLCVESLEENVSSCLKWKSTHGARTRICRITETFRAASGTYFRPLITILGIMLKRCFLTESIQEVSLSTWRTLAYCFYILFSITKLASFIWFV